MEYSLSLVQTIGSGEALGFFIIKSRPGPNIKPAKLFCKTGLAIPVPNLTHYHSQSTQPSACHKCLLLPISFISLPKKNGRKCH